ncbi:MAG: cell division protein FtsA [Candidatus Aegiribacteria sp.]|nr:cell division protein FtsA [Candidatus Aegiribacteria sp.]
MNPEIYSGIDVGSKNVICVVAEADEEGVLHITGAGQASTSGSVIEGVIVDLQGAAEAVSQAIEEAESLSSWKIIDTSVSISGSHVRGFPGRGTVNVEREDDFVSGKVTWMDIEDATETAQLIKLPRESMILRTEKCGYTIDGSSRLLRPPVGLRAERLTADIYMITADRTAVLNLEQVIRDAGKNVSAIYPAASAAARSVLTPDEMEIGVVLADIGADTTDIAVFHSGVLAHLSVIPCGGESITRDLQQIRIPRYEAERLKREYIDIARRSKTHDKEISVSTFGGRSTIPITDETVNEIAYRSAGNLLGDILCELKQAGIQESDLPAGIVLSGGTAYLRGLTSVASRIIGIPVEVGKPGGIDMSSSLIESAEFANAVGLVLLSHEEESEYEQRKISNPLSKAALRLKGLIRKLR